MKFKATSLLFLILSFSYFSGIALAAEMITDVGGNWVGVVTLENGQELPYDITISQEGTTASGFLAGIGGPDITITDVRLEENILSIVLIGKRNSKRKTILTTPIATTRPISIQLGIQAKM